MKLNSKKSDITKISKHVKFAAHLENSSEQTVGRSFFIAHWLKESLDA